MELYVYIIDIIDVMTFRSQAERQRDSHSARSRACSSLQECI